MENGYVVLSWLLVSSVLEDRVGRLHGQLKRLQQQQHSHGVTLSAGDTSVLDTSVLNNINEDIHWLLLISGISHSLLSIEQPLLLGGPDGRVVKVLDSQPRDRGFESRDTVGLLCLKSLAKICTPNVPWGDRWYAIVNGKLKSRVNTWLVFYLSVPDNMCLLATVICR